MDLSDNWISVDVPEIETLPRPVFLRSQCLPARHIFPVHSHRWNQLVYATSGTLVVTVEDCWYVITPEQAIWVPTGVLHTTGALNGAEFRISTSPTSRAWACREPAPPLRCLPF